MDDQTAAPIADPAAVSQTSETPSETPSPTPSDRLARMSPAETAAWRQDGTVPGVEDAPVSAHGDGDDGDDDLDATREALAAGAAASAPPPPVDPAASAAGKALNRQKQTAQQKINELSRKVYLLEGELAGVRSTPSSRSAATAEASAPAPTAASPSDAGLVEPKEEDFDTYAQFVRATARYETRLAHAELDRTRAAEQGQRQYAEVASAHDARVKAFAEATPDYDDVIRHQTEVMPTPLLAEAVLHSELAPQIAYYLNSHVDEYRALVGLPPGPMLKALGKLEARLEAGSPGAAAASAAATPNHVTRAPAPPPTLGTRPALPADGVEAAVASRDVGRYIREQNARDLAARR